MGLAVTLLVEISPRVEIILAQEQIVQVFTILELLVLIKVQYVTTYKVQYFEQVLRLKFGHMYSAHLLMSYVWHTFNMLPESSKSK